MKKLWFLLLVVQFGLMVSCVTDPGIGLRDAQLKDYAKQLAALEAADQAKQKLVDDLRTQVVDLKNAVASRELGLEELQLKLAALQAKADKLAASQDQVAALQKQLDDKLAIIAKLSLGDAKMQALLDTNAKLQASISDLNKQLAASLASVKDLTSQKQASADQLARMASSFDQSAKRIVALEAGMADLKKLLGQREASIAGLQNQVTVATKANADLLDQLSSLKVGTKVSDADYLRQINALKTAAIASSQKITDQENQIGVLTESSQKDAKELDTRIATLSKTLAKQIASGDITIKRYRNTLVIDVKDTILFAPDRAELLPANLGLLDILAEGFKLTPDGIVRVEGNTAVAISSPEALKLYPTSWHLGAARATNVVQYLQEKAGMDPHQLVVASLGEYNPKAPNTTDDGKSQNRRVEFVVVAKALWQLDRLAEVLAK